MLYEIKTERITSAIKESGKMFVYEIPMKFKKASAGFVYSTMQRELNVGKEQFNEKAENRKNGC